MKPNDEKVIRVNFVFFKTAKSFMDVMRHRNGNPRMYTSYAFDSVWAAALLFQKSLAYPKYRPENVTFNDIITRNHYAWFLSETQFDGLTVRL
jgi:hypothetical protein